MGLPLALSEYTHHNTHHPHRTPDNGPGPHPWNDIAVDSQGNAFVGCIGFDFPAGEFAPAPGRGAANRRTGRSLNK